MNATFPIRRAWNATCPEGELRDYFCNQVASRILSRAEANDSAVAGYPAELVEDFLERCDALFAGHNPETPEEAAALAETVDVAPLFDYVGEE